MKKNKELKTEIEKKKKLEIDELIKLKEKYLDNWKRTEADFLNYKKDEDIRIRDHIFYNQKKIILDILSLLDAVILAEDHLPSELKEDKWVLGVLQFKFQINNLLKNYNLKEIKSLGEIADFNFHEVLQEIETKEEKSGTIIKEVQKGYLLNGKVIRPAKVIIAK